MKHLLKINILTAIFAIALFSCKKKDDTKPPEPKTPVITITTQPANATVTESATLSYQWYASTTLSNTGGTAIGGATNASFTIPTSLAAGKYYYFCEVKATGGAEAKRSSAATVTVNAAGTPSTPVITITTQPAATTNVTAGSISGSLTVAATVTGGATLSYQWYSNTTNNTTGGTAVGGATSASFTLPTTLAAGITHFYFCEVSATGGATSKRSSVAAVTVAAAGSGEFCGGTGTKDAPYLICNAAQLTKLVGLMQTENKYYKLMDDIDISSYGKDWNGGKGWKPIGASNPAFRGHFDGNNHKVTGLYINDDNLKYAGLFGSIIDATVQNLTVEGEVTGKECVGGVVGTVDFQSVNCVISNCHANVKVSGNNQVGGVAGSIYGSTITGCSSTGAVSGIGSGSRMTGGIVGWANLGGIVNNCFATGAVSGNIEVGGVVGSYRGISVSNCYSTGAVSGNSGVGGVVSDCYTTNSITNCYATGAISGADFVFGVAEYSKNCAALNPSLTNTTGGIGKFRRLDGDVGVAWEGMILPYVTLSGTDITTAEAKAQATYEALGWKFGEDDENPWKMGNAAYPLPVLYWQEPSTYPTLPTHLQ